MITAPGGVDAYGRFPELCPNGSGFSAKIGNETASITGGIGNEASGVSYIYNIPATVSTFSLLFHYAVVMHEGSHTPAQQSRFRAIIRDVTSGNVVPCANFDFVVGSSLPGFQVSPINPQVRYKDWTPVSIDLSSLIGRTIEVEFITSECTQQGHFCYAYIDVNSNCNGAITGNYICPGNSGITLTAPFGFQNYTWYSDNTFTTVLANTQTLTVSPAPPTGTIYPVKIEPYPGFGCQDTLYADVQIAGNPVSNAGADQTICLNDHVQIGTTSTPGLTYVWTPANLVSNPIISDPQAWNPNVGVPAELIVTTTDILTGCTSKDTTYITSQQADTTLTFSGKNTYCADDSDPGILSVNPAVLAVQWYNGNTPIPGATSHTYQPTVSGSYWAQVQQLGCTDSTRITNFTINPVPVSVAGADASVCINETIQLGTAPDPAYTYTWTPAAQVSDPAIANPQAWATGTTPQQFIVHTVDAATGCNSYDTTIITGLVMDTTMQLTGKPGYCEGDAAAGTLSVKNTLSSVQWYDGATPIPGATGYTFQPLVSGDYWARLGNGACVDSTRTVTFTISKIPVADFLVGLDSLCISAGALTITNQSASTDPMTYLWQFSDGTSQTTTDAVKTFTTPGTYTVRLTATTGLGCTNTTSDSTIHVMPNGKANFQWDSICIDRPVQFTNQSNENGSPAVQYIWRFNNSMPDVFMQNPPPVVYSTPGLVDVTLRLEALGCENFADSIVRKVQVNKPKDGIQYRNITVAEGAREYIHARAGVGNIYNWQPRLQLSNYTAQYTQFTATDDQQYIITITDPHTCITVDTLQMLVLKKPGYYLPTAFTPNGDGLNDFAIPYLVGMKGLKSFTVYNRGGQLLFATTTYQQGWDGKHKGEAQPNGVYVWVLEYYDNNNLVVQQKGTITLIR